MTPKLILKIFYIKAWSENEQQADFFKKICQVYEKISEAAITRLEWKYSILLFNIHNNNKLDVMNKLSFIIIIKRCSSKLVFWKC